MTARRRQGLAQRAWRTVRQRLVGSRFVTPVIVRTVAGYLRIVHLTNPLVPGSGTGEPYVRDYAPFICALWHGQHVMAPFLRPRGLRVTALFSRSADAEINARVAEALGFETVRGSGGRGARGRKRRRAEQSKGGARALIRMKRVLDGGGSVGMIADIAHGKPREAGLGIILLAKISGRPILPLAYASSRYRVVEKSWDKTTIPLPFGRAAALAAEPVFVPADADEATLEAKRVELTDKLNAITTRAYELAGAAR